MSNRVDLVDVIDETRVASEAFVVMVGGLQDCEATGMLPLPLHHSDIDTRESESSVGECIRGTHE
ncbi:Hypothetical predicted protein [Scomber scombrus]|uniref:Uncharacterized protein n=1 Tax=Scomber scombrus TaxID=13677 RepID=A0AAV1PU61_SCOSC